MSDPIWGDDAPYQRRRPPAQSNTAPPEGLGNTVTVLVFLGLALAVVVGVAYLFVTHFPAGPTPLAVPTVTPSGAAPSPTLALLQELLAVWYARVDPSQQRSTPHEPAAPLQMASFPA